MAVLCLGNPWGEMILRNIASLVHVLFSMAVLFLSGCVPIGVQPVDVAAYAEGGVIYMVNPICLPPRVSFSVYLEGGDEVWSGTHPVDTSAPVIALAAYNFESSQGVYDVGQELQIFAQGDEDGVTFRVEWVPDRLPALTSNEAYIFETGEIVNIQEYRNDPEACVSI